MYDLIIVGGGMWGTASMIHAYLADHSVLILDNKKLPGATRVATGIVCRNWYYQDTVSRMLPASITQREIDSSIDWLVNVVGYEKIGEKFSGYHRNDWITREDSYVVPSDRMKLYHTDDSDHANVLRFDTMANKVVVYLEGGERVEGKRLLIAAGAWTDELLVASGFEPVGVRKLLGRAFVYKSDYADFTVPQVYMVGPYKHLTIREYYAFGKKQVRIGDTVEKVATAKSKEAWDDRLYQVMDMLTPGHGKVLYEQVGYRPVCDTMYIDHLPGHTNVAIAVGGHRVGAGLCEAVAKLSMGLLSL